MKNQRNKTFSAIALTILMAMSAFMITTNVVSAAPIIGYFQTSARCSPIPNVVGVGQTIFISIGVQPVPPISSLTADPQYEWNGMMIYVMKPNGQNDTIGPKMSDPTGSTYAQYTPTQTGKYTFQMYFPGQWMNYTSGGQNYTSYYYPSWSLSQQGVVQVQQEQILPIPNNPLPTGYWTRPIYGENKGWNTIADNWLMNGYDYQSRSFTIASTFSPYTSAPESPHVLWTTPIEFGGELGGQFGDRSYYTGLSYEQFYSPLYIIQGQIIYTDHGPGSSAAAYGTRCLSLYTGQQLWYLANTTFAFAQVLEMDTPNEHGGLPYLWSTSGTTWTMWDAFSANTGQPPRMICVVANVTSGSAARRGAINIGPNGEMLAYNIGSVAVPNSTLRSNWMTLWNSTLAIMGPPGPAVATWSPTVSATPIDGNRGIQWNVTLPSTTFALSIMEANGGYVLASNTSGISLTYAQTHMAFPAILNRDANGNYPKTLDSLWVANRSIYMSSYKFSNINDGAYAMFDEITSTLFCFDIKTGQQKWVADPLTTPWGVFSGYTIMIAYGRIYESGYDGTVRAYNVNDGSIAWSYYQGSSGFETPYGTWPSYWGMNIADGKVYMSNDEHSPDATLWRGGKFICLDATSGKMIFNMSGQMHEGAISDGYYTAMNNYDGLAYCFGKGPSKTTITAPQVAVSKGTGVMITGTVTDQSPGKPNTPAISDADMPAWMEYLYQQKPIPTHAAGVEVMLTAVDPNHNTITIGTAVSDIGGSYGILWTPTIEGTYQVMATFAGSKSYGDSYATTYVAVGAPTTTVQPSVTSIPTPTATLAPTASPSPTPSSSVAPTPPGNAGIGVEYYVVIAAAVIIIAIAVVAVVLRRRK
jgi:hypothetical protein